MRYYNLEHNISFQRKPVIYDALGVPLNVIIENDNKLFVSAFSIARAYSEEKNPKSKEKLLRIYERISKFFAQLYFCAKNNDLEGFSNVLDIDKVSEKHGTCANILPLGHGKSNSNSGNGLTEEDIRIWFLKFREYEINTAERFEFIIEGVGEDKISDLLTNVIGDILAEYSDGILSQLDITKTYRGYSVGLAIQETSLIYYWDGSWKQHKVNYNLFSKNKRRIQILVPKSVVLTGIKYDGETVFTAGNIKRYSRTIVRDIIIQEFTRRGVFTRFSIDYENLKLGEIERFIKEVLNIKSFEGLNPLLKLGSFLHLDEQQLSTCVIKWIGKIEENISVKVNKKRKSNS